MFKTVVILVITFLIGVASAAELVVTATNEGISVPETVESGYTNFVLDNQADAVYAHEIVRLKEGANAELFKKAIIALFSDSADEATFAEIMASTDAFLGGVVGTEPGARRSVGLVLSPGIYVIYADQLADNSLVVDDAHTAIITVTEAANPAPEPVADMTIKLAEYAFALPGDIKAGTYLVKFENIGHEDHLGFVFKLPDGMTAEEAMHSENQSPDWSMAQGVHAVGAGSTVYVEMSFDAGATYLFDCPLPTDQGVSHDELGMMQFVTIPEN